MRKFLSVVMLCVLSLPMSVEALAWSEGKNEPFGVLVAAARTKKKAPARKKTPKKQNGLMTSISLKQTQEFVKIFETGSLQKLKAKLEKEKISPNATYRSKEYGVDDSLLTLAAALTSNAEIVKFLLSKGADINKGAKGDRDVGPETITVNNVTAMMKAVQKGNPEVIKALLDAEANINAKDDGDMTALDWALETSRIPRVIKMLIDAGADVRGSLPYASTESFSGGGETKPEIWRMLIDAGANVKAKGCEDLLITAAANTNEYPEVIEILLNAGANAKFKNDEGMRAIDFARDNPKLKGTKALKMLEEASR